MKAILTKYLGPTDCKGSRITAWDCDGNRATVPYDHALSGEAVHREAAIALVHKMGWSPVTLVEGCTKVGYAFVILQGAHPYSL